MVKQENEVKEKKNKIKNKISIDLNVRFSEVQKEFSLRVLV